MTDIKKNRTKEVLERLKAQEAKPKPKLEKFPISKKQSSRENSEKLAMPQSIYQIKLERIINRLDDLERKMKDGDNYFTHYWDYSKVCKEFNDILKEFEKFETNFVPAHFKKRVENTKIKVETYLNRKIPDSKPQFRNSKDPINT